MQVSSSTAPGSCVTGNKNVGISAVGFTTVPPHQPQQSFSHNQPNLEMLQRQVNQLMAMMMQKGSSTHASLGTPEDHIGNMEALEDDDQVPENVEAEMCDGWDRYDWENLPSPLFGSLENYVQSGAKPD
ncbi:hypothetical protein POM88_018086 [Heracleum sosnowskyi]|uniref:Uncharacterized protein n=1 Tax=Heracleum sosnowskyi TaxID=360622 RepID=A0AAD8IRW4_9APIA|nr:hypothetical protein POM88_018086 [Heracleum sosnowskyi]